MPSHAVPTRRSWSTRPALVVVVLLAATSLSFAPFASAATPTFGLGAGFDGTNQGTSQACPITGAGGDNTAHDGVVCTNDQFGYGWAYNIPPNMAVQATFTQTLSSTDTRWDQSNLTVCQGGGASPFTGSGTISPDGLKLICTLSWPASAGALSGNVPVTATALPSTPSGTQVTAPLVVDVTQPSVSTQNLAPSPITIVSQPRVDLQKTLSYYGPSRTSSDELMLVSVLGETDSTNTKGFAAITGGVSFVDDLQGMPGGTKLLTPGNCYLPPQPGQPSVPSGAEGTWTCSQSAPGQPITIDITGARTDGVGSPVDSRGRPVLSGTFFVLVPDASLPASGSVTATDQLTGFDPFATAANGSQNSNYGAGYEPGGAPGDTCSNPTGNNNCSSANVSAFPRNVPFFGKTLLLPHAPTLYAMPGDKFTAQLSIGIASPQLDGIVACDKWDPAKQRIDDTSQPTMSFADGTVPPFTVEYTNHAYTDDADRSAHACGDTDGPWFSDVASAGGPSAVTGVRFLLGEPLPTSGPVLFANVPMVSVDTTSGDSVVDYGSLNWTGGTQENTSASFTATDNLLGLTKVALDSTNQVISSAAADSVVHYQLRPTYDAPPGQDAVVTVTDTLPVCEINPVLEPASVGVWTMTVQQGDPGPDGIFCTSDDASNTVLTFTSTAPVTPNAAPVIDYDVRVSAIVADNTSMINTANISAPDNAQTPAERHTAGVVTARSVSQITMQKSADRSTVEVTDPVGFTLQWSNTSSNTAGQTQWIDKFPYNGDGRGSAFTGSIQLTSAQLNGDATGVTLEYTSANPAGVSDDPNDASNQGGGTIWCTQAQFGNPGCPVALAAATAVRITIGDFYASRVGSVDLKFDPSGNANGDVYANTVGLGRAAALTQPVPVTATATVNVVGSSVGNLVWQDYDKNGVQDPGEPGIPNVYVDLVDSNNVVVARQQTAADGSYDFTNVHSGTYSVRVEANSLPQLDVPTYDRDNGTTNPNGDSGPFTLAPNSTVDDADFGYFLQTVSIALTKTVKSLSGSASTPQPGDVVTYEFDVTNTGTAPLDYVLSDQQVAPSGPVTWDQSCQTGSLAAGASLSCTATYALSQQDIDSGSLNDTGQACGSVPGAVPACATSSASLALGFDPQLSVTKTPSLQSVGAAGQTIDYSIHVTNTGNVTISNISVSDATSANATGATSSTCTPQNLGAGQSMTCDIFYTPDQAAINSGGPFDDTVTAQGTAPPNASNQVVQATASARVGVNQSPNLTIQKSVDPSTGTISQPGQQIQYDFVVTNNGNVSVVNIQVHDTQTAAAAPLDSLSCPPSPGLNPGESETCTGVYTVQQADLDRGFVSDSANATGQAGLIGLLSASSSTTYPLQQNPNVALVKSTTSTPQRAGDPIDYTFDVTNTGNVTLSGLALDDAQSSPSGPVHQSVPCPQQSLAPGQTMTCTLRYDTTQADFDSGSADDTATATGTGGDATVNATSSVSVALPQTAQIGLLKTASPSAGVNAAGDPIAYTFQIDNQGTVTLSNIQLVDQVTSPAGAPITITCPQTSLASAHGMTCTVFGTATQADIDNGVITDTATVTATTPSNATASATSSARILVNQNPGIAVTKAANVPSVNAVGQTIDYSFDVQNTGNVTVSGVQVADQQQSPANPSTLAVICPPVTLAPGQGTICSAQYTVTQADLDHGSIDDSATASALTPQNQPVTATASLRVPAVQTPALTVTKTPSPATVSAPGQTITYTFDVHNGSNITLDNVVLTDTQAAPAGPLATGPSCPATSIPAGADMTCTATYVATQQDIDNGKIDDTVVASATNPAGTTTVTDTATANVTALQTPALTLQKTAAQSSVTAAGQVVHYTFEVRNTGNVTLDPVVVTDAQAKPAGTLTSDPTCPRTTLAPGDVEDCTGSYTVTQADIDNGSIDDTATATGTPHVGNPVSATSSASVPATLRPSLRVVKSAAQQKVKSAGDVIDYSFVVTNTGNTTLHAVTVHDAQQSSADQLTTGPTCTTTTLAPGASVTCTATYVVTSADIALGSIADSAVADATAPNGDPVASDASALVVGVAPTDSGLAKTGSSALAEAGYGVGLLVLGALFLIVGARRRHG